MTRRLVLLLLAALFVAFAAYGSFVPLRFRSVGLAEAVQQFVATPLAPLGNASGSDFITNVLLFVPIGFFLLGAAADRSPRMGFVFLLPVVAVGVAASVAIEFGQIFVHERTPSWNDVVAESLGGAIGAVTWMAVGRFIVEWFEALFQTESEGDRLYRILGVYAGVWVVLNLLPFDFTMRLEELGEKFRAGRIVFEPFKSGWTVRDVGGTLMMAIPLGVFGVVLARGRRLPRTAMAGLGVGLLVTLATEAAQAFSYSRTADTTDVLMNAAGVGVGTAVATRWSQGVGRAADTGGGLKLWPVAALAVWCVTLAIRHWSPFDFVTDPAFIKSRIPGMFAVPFHSYYWGFAPSVLADATTKLMMAVPVGALMQLVWQPQARVWRWVMGLSVVALSGALFLGIELGQLMVPSRVADQTDVYIGTLGALLGVWLVAFINRNRTTPRVTDAGEPVGAASRPRPPAGS